MTATIQVSSHRILDLNWSKMRFASLSHRLNESELDSKALSVTSATELRQNVPQRFTTNSISPEKKRRKKKTSSGCTSAVPEILNMSKIPYIGYIIKGWWHETLTAIRSRLTSSDIKIACRRALKKERRWFPKKDPIRKKRLIKLKQNSSLQLCDKKMSFSVLALHNLCLTVHKKWFVFSQLHYELKLSANWVF